MRRPFFTTLSRRGAASRAVLRAGVHACRKTDIFRLMYKNPCVKRGWVNIVRLLLAFLLAGAGAQAAAAENLPQVRGVFGGPDKPAAMVARNPAEYQRLARVFGERRVPHMPDFSHYLIAAVAMGRRATGGYTVEILGIRVRHGVATIRYRESSPAPGAMVIQAFTAPYAIRVLPAVHATKVMFERECKPVVHAPFSP